MWKNRALPFNCGNVETPATPQSSTNGTETDNSEELPCSKQKDCMLLFIQWEAEVWWNFRLFYAIQPLQFAFICTWFQLLESTSFTFKSCRIIFFLMWYRPEEIRLETPKSLSQPIGQCQYFPSTESQSPNYTSLLNSCIPTHAGVQLLQIHMIKN